MTGTTAANMLPQAADYLRAAQRQLQPAMGNATPGQQRVFAEQMANLMAEQTDLANELDAAAAQLPPAQQQVVGDQIQRMQQRMQSMMQVMGAVATPAASMTPGPATAGQMAGQMNEMQSMMRRNGAQLSATQMQDIMGQMGGMLGDMAQAVDTLAPFSTSINDARESKILQSASNISTLAQRMLQATTVTAPAIITTTTSAN